MRRSCITARRKTVIKINIVEDNKDDAATLRKALERYGAESGLEFGISEYSSSLKFLSEYKPDADIVFMDIELPDADGMTAAHSLREIDDSVCLIFVTNMAKFAIKGYEVGSYDFIVKPIVYASFAVKLKRALAHLRSREAKSVIVASGYDKVRLNILNIYYVEVMGHKLIYHTKDGDVISYGTLKSVEELLDDKLFVRCNNCYLVNLRYVTAIKNGCAIVGGSSLAVSAPKRAAFEKALTDHLCEH